MPADSRAVEVLVPAKVNLHLAVGDLRADGFHELVTVFHAVSLYDRVVASPADELSIGIEGEGQNTLPTDEGNLVWRAAQLLADTAGVPARARLDVTKQIPVGGGLAGGSADAAATLLACAHLWDVDADLAALAAQLGSDVAFPLLGGTALGTGRGEILAPIPVPRELEWVLAISDFEISAGDSYRELDRQRSCGEAPAPAGSPDALLAALSEGDVYRTAALLANDLQPAALALAPSLREVLDVGRKAGALAGIVSGSGPTCAFLCADDGAADEVAAVLDESGTIRTRRASGDAAPALVPR